MKNTTTLAMRSKQMQAVIEALAYWKKYRVISSDQETECRSSISTLLFDWRRLAQFSFWVASFFLVCTISSLIGQFQWSETQIFIILALLSTVTFGLGAYMDKVVENQPRAAGALYSLGLLFMFGAFTQCSEWPELWTAILGGIISIGLDSGITWGLSLASLGIWVCQVGPETSINDLNLSLSDPRKIAFIFGISATVITITTILLLKVNVQHVKRVLRGSLITSYLFLYASLFSLSTQPQGMPFSAETLIWAILLAAFSILAIFCGIKYKLPITLRYGVVFSLLLIYGQYVNYLTNLLDPTVFLLLLSGVFWLTGCLSLYAADNAYKLQ